MANIQIGFSKTRDSNVTVWDLFEEITNQTCPFCGRTKWGSFGEELLENYTFRSSGQLSDKISDVNFEWCEG